MSDRITFRIILAFLFLFSLFAAQTGNSQPLTKIPDSLVTVSSGYAVAVDKNRQKLYVFKKNGVFSKVFETNCSTGKNQGRKQVSGDARTPVGVFFVTRKQRNPGPPETYGTLALTLDYPNVTDMKDGRNGTNIWIHGTTKPIAPFQSNGCVVLNDQDINELAKYIHIRKTPVIIAESINWINQNQTPPAKAELDKILAAWNKGYREGNIEAIDALYLQNQRISGKKREQLTERLKNINNIQEHFILEPKDVSILHQNNNAVILFDQITEISRDNSFRGSFHKLALQKVNHSWFIIDDAGRRDSEQKPAALASARPVAVAVNTSASVTALPAVDAITKEEIRKLIDRWAKNWESGNMPAFRSCYTSNFRAQGKNLNDWINHKIAVRKNSKNIKVRVDNLQISGGGNNQASVTFTQHYSSSILKSKGNKKMELRKTGSQWKIYRESMQ